MLIWIAKKRAVQREDGVNAGQGVNELLVLFKVLLNVCAQSVYADVLQKERRQW